MGKKRASGVSIHFCLFLIPDQQFLTNNPVSFQSPFSELQRSDLCLMFPTNLKAQAVTLSRLLIGESNSVVSGFTSTKKNKKHSKLHVSHILPVERSWNLSLVFFFLHFQGLNSLPNVESFPRCCCDPWAFLVLEALSTTTSQLATDDFSKPSTRTYKNM